MNKDSGLLNKLEMLTNRAMETGDLTAAAEHAAIHAALRMGTRWYPAGPALSSVQECLVPKRTLTIGKLRHDADQFLYLQRRGILGREFTEIINKYERLIDRMTPLGRDPRVPLADDDLEDVGAVYGRLAHVRDTPRMPGTIFGSWHGHVVENEYLTPAPGVVVIDNFLSDEALRALYEFCLESTVWSTNHYMHNRLGAFFRDGFNCPLLIQIAMELRERLPNVIGTRYPLRQMWAFKYDHALPSNPVHADFAAVNVNFWITPDEANLDRKRGGLLVYDIEAPLDWDFDTYNRRTDKIQQLLYSKGARPIAIPYRQNRAVIFNSDLFHATAPMNFRRDYECRRVNVTMLYGDRVNALHRVKESLFGVPR